jgi:hypothetical protein
MAENSEYDKPTHELRAEIASSRERVARDLRALHYELDFPRKIRRSFREQTMAWLTAAAAVGTLFVLLPVRKKKIYVDAKTDRKSRNKLVETGFALGALKIAAGLLRPVIVDLIKTRLTGYAGRARIFKKH